MTQTRASLRTKALLLDIEGTTTPAEFVYKTLFPYARLHLEEFLQRENQRPEVQADLDQLQNEYASEAERESNLPLWKDDSLGARLDSASRYALWLMDRDRKSTGLKSLQGKIWEQGYQRGELRSLVYNDVPAAFARWCDQRKAIAIFSSGSVLAQKLLFQNTTSGDLTHFILAYFDTATGPKKEAESYRRIAGTLGFDPAEILFISDVTAELDAAAEAGLGTALCVRTGSPASEESRHSVIHSFDKVFG